MKLNFKLTEEFYMYKDNDYLIPTYKEELSNTKNNYRLQLDSKIYKTKCLEAACINREIELDKNKLYESLISEGYDGIFYGSEKDNNNEPI